LKGNLVAATSVDPSISAYASRFGKTLSLILINKDRRRQRSLEVDLKNFAPHAKAKFWILGESRKYNQQGDISRVSKHLLIKALPYSITAIELIERDSVIPPTNLASVATPSASSYSTIGPHFKPASAIDGVMDSRWNSAAWTKSNGQEAQWFQLAWPKAQHIGIVRICWGETYGSDYKLLSSADGRKWETLREVTNGHGGVEEIAVGGIKARYLKIIGSRGTKGISAYSIREFEAYEQSTMK
jgi:hypothetical protein